MVPLTSTRSSEEELRPVSFSAQHHHNQESDSSTSPMWKPSGQGSYEPYSHR
jgi:hypothetical protein